MMKKETKKETTTDYGAKGAEGVRVEVGGYVLDFEGVALFVTCNGGGVPRDEHPALFDLVSLLFDDSVDMGADLDELREAFETERKRSTSLLAAWHQAAEVHERKEAEWELDKIRAAENYREVCRLRNLVQLSYVEEASSGANPDLGERSPPEKLSPQDIAASVAADHIEPQPRAEGHAKTPEVGA